MRCRCSRRHVIAPTRRSEQVGRWRGPSATRRTAAAAGSDPPGTSPAGRAASRFNGRGQQAAHRSYRRTEGAVSGGRAGRWHRIRRAASAAVPAPTCCASWTTPGRQHLPGIPCGQQNGRDLPLLATLRADNAISPEGPDGPSALASEPLWWIPDLVAGAVGAAPRPRHQQSLTRRAARPEPPRSSPKTSAWCPRPDQWFS
jgi:hypothetical protein